MQLIVGILSNPDIALTGWTVELTVSEGETDTGLLQIGAYRLSLIHISCPPAVTQTWPLYIRQIDAFQEKLSADYKAALLDDCLLYTSTAPAPNAPATAPGAPGRSA